MKASHLLTTSTLCAVLGLGAPSAAHAQFTYTYFPNNGTLDTPVSTDFVIVGYSGGGYDDNFNRNFTGPSSPTVTVAAGADAPASEMDIFHSSTVNVTGGANFGGIIPYDNSTINFLAGSNPFVLSFDNSIVNMKGGAIYDLEGQGKSVLVSGGNITSKLVAGSQFDTASTLDIGSCIVDVTGGILDGKIDAFNQGILNLRGGALNGDLVAAFGGTINVFGSNLTSSLLDAHYQNYYSLYSISGMLSDGTALNNKGLAVLNDGVAYGHASFNLISTSAVPEPGNIALLLSGIVATGVNSLVRSRSRARK